MSFSIMTQCLPGMYSTLCFVDINTLISPITIVAPKFVCSNICMLFSSGIVHITGVHSDDHLGQREAQSLQQGIQGLSQPPDGNYPPDYLIVIKI